MADDDAVDGRTVAEGHPVVPTMADDSNKLVPVGSLIYDWYGT